jgi:hypothetical protein
MVRDDEVLALRIFPFNLNFDMVLFSLYGSQDFWRALFSECSR